MVDLFVMVLFVAGFVAIIKGADVLIEGASAIAKRFGVSAYIIGLTIVAFGTSVPELSVNLSASLHGSTDIVISNVIGSNIANVFLVLGFAAIMMPVFVKQEIVRTELPIALFAALLVLFLANDVLITGSTESFVDRIDGIVLLTFFAVFGHYIYHKVQKGKSRKQVEELSEVELSHRKLLKSIMFIIIGIAGLTIGGDWIVDGALEIASEFGVSEGFIGLTIIAIGTSISELAATAMAVKKRASEIAVGNIIGSNIFNILWILGLSAVIRPIPIEFGRNVDIGIMLFSTLLMFVFLLYVGKKYELKRWQGFLFLLMYVGFIALSIFRG